MSGSAWAAAEDTEQPRAKEPKTVDDLCTTTRVVLVNDGDYDVAASQVLERAAKKAPKDDRHRSTCEPSRTLCQATTTTAIAALAALRSEAKDVNRIYARNDVRLQRRCMPIPAFQELIASPEPDTEPD